MTKLSDLAHANGFTMKEVSNLTKIPYTTLMSMAKTGINHWEKEKKDKIETLLGNLEEPILQPFLKWVGGKRQLLKEIRNLLPETYNNYFEPFLGGGAVLLNIAPTKAYINDKNEELINCWNVIKENPNELLNILKKHQENNCKEYYLNIRSTDRDGRIVKMSEVERAARFIYLNKAGYNGLWRVNSKGQNNVPYANPKKLNLLMADRILNVSKYLNENEIHINNKHFTYIKGIVKKDDFVYFDPPYIPLTMTSSFTSYTKEGFGEVQQFELRDLILELTKKGVKVMLSNSDSLITRELYSDDIFFIHEVSAKRMINSNADKRGKIGELIITNY